MPEKLMAASALLALVCIALLALSWVDKFLESKGWWR